MSVQESILVCLLVGLQQKHVSDTGRLREKGTKFHELMLKNNI